MCVCHCVCECECPHLVVDDGCGSGREWDGGAAADELTHLLPTAQTSVSGERPQDAVDQVAGDILLQLVKLYLQQQQGRNQKKTTVHVQCTI